MPAPRSRRRARLSALVSVALAFTGFQLFAAPAAQAASGTVVISEVFGGNGAANLYNQDFVELHNIGASSVTLTGMSVQYRAATSGSGASSGVNLTGSIPAGGYYLVGGASTAGGHPIPTPDARQHGHEPVRHGRSRDPGEHDHVEPPHQRADRCRALHHRHPGLQRPDPGPCRLRDDPDRGETAAPRRPHTTVTSGPVHDTDDNALDFVASATGDPTARPLPRSRWPTPVRRAAPSAPDPHPPGRRDRRHGAVHLRRDRPAARPEHRPGQRPDHRHPDHQRGAPSP